MHYLAPLDLGYPDYRMSNPRSWAKVINNLSAGAKPVAAATGDQIAELVMDWKASQASIR